MTDFATRPPAPDATPDPPSGLTTRKRVGAVLAKAPVLSGQILAIISLGALLIMMGWTLYAQVQFWMAERRLNAESPPVVASTEPAELLAIADTTEPPTTPAQTDVPTKTEVPTTAEIVAPQRNDHTVTTSIRNFLCNAHTFDTAGQTDLNREQVIVRQIYEIKEVARQHAVPFDPAGRVAYFFRCRVISGVSTSSITFDAVVKPQKNVKLTGTALINYEWAHYELASEHFADEIPPIILETWGASINALETLIDPSELLKPIAPDPEPDATHTAVALTEEPTKPPATDPETPTGGPGEEPQVVTTPPGKDPADETVAIVAAVAGNLSDKWLLIVGSDRDAEAALFEVGRLKRVLKGSYEITLGNNQLTKVTFPKGSPLEGSVVLLVTGSRYRTVAVFETREAADLARQALQTAGVIRLDAYTRNVASWCDGEPKQANSLKGVAVFACS